MLTINPNEEKTINFVVEVNGVGCEEMNGFVRFIFEDIEYGFPVSFHGDEISATIKPLNDLFEGRLKNGTILEARLDLAAPEHNYYFNPWADEIQIKMPVSVEARVIENGSGGKKPSVSVRAKPISERKKAAPRRVDKKELAKQKLKNLSEKDIIDYMKRAGTKNETIQQIVLNEATSSAVEKGYKGNVGILREVVRALKKPK